ncbi:MAG: TiaS agmantine-binding domain-containing protein [Halobacteriota archaeon]
MLIGIDDTDSPRGMCTTYLGTILKKTLEQELSDNIELRLIRLNPTIKFKTRGNAAICIAIEHSYDVLDIVRKHIEQMAHLDHEATHPGAVILEDETVPSDIQSFANDAVHAELRISDATALIDKHSLDFLSFKKGRGLIGALAAIGAVLSQESTFELIAYRFQGNFGEKRYVNTCSVKFADLTTYPYTWDTVDRKNKQVIFAPHSPDPILYGIRGGDPYQILNAHRNIISEPFEHLTLFKTNQGTDAHVRNAQIRDLKEGCSYIVTATITNEPQTAAGGHTFFEVEDDSGTLKCAAFEPTKQFRLTVRKLRLDDAVIIQGSYIDNCLHLEKLQIVSLSDLYTKTNPLCCKKSMKSLGHKQGYRCVKCKTIQRVPYVIKTPERRGVKVGAYEVTPSARRHLAEPLIRRRDKGYAVFPSR